MFSDYKSYNLSEMAQTVLPLICYCSLKYTTQAYVNAKLHTSQLSDQLLIQHSRYPVRQSRLVQS
jgi:hypothetical protein